MQIKISIHGYRKAHQEEGGGTKEAIALGPRVPTITTAAAVVARAPGPLNGFWSCGRLRGLSEGDLSTPYTEQH